MSNLFGSIPFNKDNAIFSEKEIETLVSSAILGGASDDECQKLVEWATLIKISNAVLETIFLGNTVIGVWENSEPYLIKERE